jgi:hypothetical protein
MLNLLRKMSWAEFAFHHGRGHLVGAKVYNYGRVIEHERGYRSQFQRLEQLYYYPHLTEVNLETAQQLAQFYKVPLIVDDSIHLEEVA